MAHCVPHDPAPVSEVPLDPAQTDETYVLLNVFDANASENVREQALDGRRYLVETSSLDHPDLLASRLELDEVRNATLEMVVTSDGRIEEYRVTFQGTYDGTIVRGERNLWYEAVDETTVEAPEWVDGVED